MEENKGIIFEQFVRVVQRLRQECPWDSTQTLDSLKICLADETKEVLESIDILAECGQGENLCEELGDVLFNIILQCVIAEEQGLFTIEDMISGISSKMVYRHPRIFSPDDSEAAALSWDELKQKEARDRLVSKNVTNYD